MFDTFPEASHHNHQKDRAAKIIAAVPRSRAHETAETALSEARRRHSEIAAEIRTLIGQPRVPGAGDQIERRLVTLDREAAQLRDATIPPLRREALAGREIHGDAIRAACMSVIVEAAAEARNALSIAHEALQTLNYINDQIYRAGGTPMIIPTADFDTQISRLARIAEWR